MNKDNCYELLGLEPTASPSEIRTAFRKLAQKYHPDTGSIDPAHADLFKRITDAYHVLSDLDRRNDYNKSIGLHSYDELHMDETMEQAPRASEPEQQGKGKVDLGGSGKDFSHLRDSVADGDLKVAHKVALTPEEEMAKLQAAGEDVAAWGELDTGKNRSGSFGILSSFRKPSANARRAELKRNLKNTLNQESQPQKPAGDAPGVQAPKMPGRPQPRFDDDVINPFQSERVYSFQITALDAALGTSREIVLAVNEEGKSNKIEFTIPPGIEDGTVMEVSRGWDRAKVRIAVVQDPLFFVAGKDVRLRVPVTLKEILDNAEIVVPGVDQVHRVNLKAALGSTEEGGLAGSAKLAGSVEVPQAGISADGETGNLYVTPYIVPPLQISETLKAAARVVDEHCRSSVRADFMSDPTGVEFMMADHNRVDLFIPVLFGETITGAAVKVQLFGEQIELKVPGPWQHNKELAFANLPGMEDRVLILHPVIAPPEKSSAELNAAALAIEQHYLSPPRSTLPRILRKR